MPELPNQKPTLEEDIGSISDIASRVVLYNDDWHTFDEVIAQLIKAINCTYEQARALSFEVHVKGKAIVFSGSMPDCLRVSSILEEIALHTQIIT
ncbi:ATP-dependent Clp protease adaptor ClpS [Ignavibacterium album]|jgi:ATP-dependent Clp protease adapter protein ClpS|uniref:ATP-dependent Clp protease adaptor ClpS n=2 Tax=Ignavibacteriaceae TaxID=795749 RepID=UPI0026EC6A47|nr:ATP-dependent Clp protease adaptor ClpS [Ignavibacterium album]MBI5663044.1 ATP-dependent Clp protease adaptor ClpS [Ignavibacterium album]